MFLFFFIFFFVCFFFQAEDCIRDLVRSRWLGDVYKRQDLTALHALLRTEDRGRALRSGQRIVHVGHDADVALSLIHI